METFSSHEHIWEDNHEHITSLWCLLALPLLICAIRTFPKAILEAFYWPSPERIPPFVLKLKRQTLRMAVECLAPVSTAHGLRPLLSAPWTHQPSQTQDDFPHFHILLEWLSRTVTFTLATACLDVTIFEVTLPWVSHSKYASLPPGPLPHCLG